ncbi:patatin-like protein [Burkholderia contaminans]|uniref:patatin-like protein n=1 Tax=Burkholderia contaminans TaxID=488447 RepID=UPI001CF5A0E4|nr:patatin-like protein [Burkholderia contaminans]MCA7919937.1 patatin-like protein [Burkholderia contaminans]UUX40995.1 patatin-like protein [Burkholderia contaminans]
MPNEAIDELRLALVMNGGVSLAVWIGGVTNEIHRIVARKHPVYTDLLNITRTAAHVDVISGTSAGGINGAALAVVTAYGGTFSLLRDVWKEMGAFDRLLRPPLADNPGSLLMGDQYFLPEISSALGKLAVNSHTPVTAAADTPLDLYLTTTLLRGRPAYSVDDLGSQVGDVDFRARFHFVRSSERDDFKHAAPLIDTLSHAARATASFPVAFEPARINGTAIDGHPTLVDVSNTPLVTPRYVVDGGVLDNKPFHGALKAIFSKPTERGVRRVLVYIDPDPGNNDRSDVRDKASKEEPPSLGAVLAASIWNIPQSQTITDQLDEIRQHNHAVRQRRNDVLDLVCTLSAPLLLQHATQLFELYRKRRITSTFESFVYSSFPSAAAHDTGTGAKAGQHVIGKHGKDAMRTAFEAIPWQGWIPSAWPANMNAPAFECSQNWEWGLAPVDFATKVLLDLLRLTQRFHDLLDLRMSGAPTLVQRPAIAAPECAWSDPDVMDPLPARPNERADVDGLAPLWRAAYDAVKQITNFAKEEKPRWTSNAQTLLVSIGKRAAHNRHTPNARQQIAWLDSDDLAEMLAFVIEPQRRLRCARIAHFVAGVICNTCEIATDVLRRLNRDELNPVDAERARGLSRLVDFLAPASDTAGQPKHLTAATSDAIRRHVLFRLMQLDVIEYAFNDRDVLSEDALIELVQISGNASSPLAPDTTHARRKLLGLQLAHFAGFYKKSWRVNDWIFGRLDGAERLVKVLLNPERLQYVYGGRSGAAHLAADDIRRIAVDSAPSARLRSVLDAAWMQHDYGTLIAAELAYLDQTGSTPPDMLKACADAITLRLHYGILEEELGALAQAVREDVQDGADPRGPGPSLDEKWRESPSPQTAASFLQAGLIGAESLLAEPGSDLFTRTAAHTAAALQSALASKGAKLGPISALFASLRVPVLGFYFVVQGLLHRSRTSAALNGAMLTAGALLVILQFFWSQAELANPSALPHVIVLFGWAMFAYGIALSMLRTPILFVLLLPLFAFGIATSFPAALTWALVIFGFALALSLSPRLPPLQWAIGIGAIVLAGVLGSGQLEIVTCQVPHVWENARTAFARTSVSAHDFLCTSSSNVTVAPMSHTSLMASGTPVRASTSSCAMLTAKQCGTISCDRSPCGPPPTRPTACEQSFNGNQPVFALSLVVALSMLIAMCQASPVWIHLERATLRLVSRIVRRKTPIRR